MSSQLKTAVCTLLSEFDEGEAKWFVRDLLRMSISSKEYLQLSEDRKREIFDKALHLSDKLDELQETKEE